MDREHLIVFCTCIATYVALKVSGHGSSDDVAALLNAAFLSIGINAGVKFGANK